jgi:hypothetical protein
VVLLLLVLKVVIILLLVVVPDLVFRATLGAFAVLLSETIRADAFLLVFVADLANGFAVFLDVTIGADIFLLVFVPDLAFRATWGAFAILLAETVAQP